MAGSNGMRSSRAPARVHPPRTRTIAPRDCTRSKPAYPSVGHALGAALAARAHGIVVLAQDVARVEGAPNEGARHGRAKRNAPPAAQALELERLSVPDVSRSIAAVEKQEGLTRKLLYHTWLKLIGRPAVHSVAAMRQPCITNLRAVLLSPPIALPDSTVNTPHPSAAMWCTHRSGVSL